MYFYKHLLLLYCCDVQLKCKHIMTNLFLRGEDRQKTLELISLGTNGSLESLWLYVIVQKIVVVLFVSASLKKHKICKKFLWVTETKTYSFKWHYRALTTSIALKLKMACILRDMQRESKIHFLVSWNHWPNYAN